MGLCLFRATFWELVPAWAPRPTFLRFLIDLYMFSFLLFMNFLLPTQLTTQLATQLPTPEAGSSCSASHSGPHSASCRYIASMIKNVNTELQVYNHLALPLDRAQSHVNILLCQLIEALVVATIPD